MFSHTELTFKKPSHDNTNYHLPSFCVMVKNINNNLKRILKYNFRFKLYIHVRLFFYIVHKNNLSEQTEFGIYEKLLLSQIFKRLKIFKYCHSYD